MLLELLQELQVEQVVRRERLFPHHRLHRLHVLPDGVAGVLRAGRAAVRTDGRSVQPTGQTEQRQQAQAPPCLASGAAWGNASLRSAICCPVVSPCASGTPRAGSARPGSAWVTSTFQRPLVSAASAIILVYNYIIYNNVCCMEKILLAVSLGFLQQDKLQLCPPSGALASPGLPTSQGKASHPLTPTPPHVEEVPKISAGVHDGQGQQDLSPKQGEEGCEVPNDPAPPSMSLSPSCPALTSWLETSPWSFLVMPSPMADFIRREREGSTLMGG